MNTSGKANKSKIPVYDLRARYDLFDFLGEGNFGEVWLGKLSAAALSNRRSSASLVAVKSLRNVESDMRVYQNFREYLFYCNVPSHEDLVALHEIFVDGYSRKCILVMEPLEINLYQLIKSQRGKPFDTQFISNVALHVLRGMNHIHQYHYIHRDIKPENILLSNVVLYSSSCGNVGGKQNGHDDFSQMSVKIADFGLARRSDSNKNFTHYVSTRWYRAPELLFMLPYSSSMDIWAFGALMFELANLKPMFPGNSHLGQINCQLDILGTPRLAGLGGPWKEYHRKNELLDFVGPIHYMENTTCS